MFESEERDREKRRTLYLPTIHVHGLRDALVCKYVEFLQWCNIDSVRVIEWDWGHRVPTKTVKTSDVAVLVSWILKVAVDTRALI
jgi:hypothetical protein